MARSAWKWSTLVVVAVGAVIGIFAALEAPDDGLDLLRSRGVEKVTRSGQVVWHEFQFSDGCSDLKPKLSGWLAAKRSKKGSLRLTDMEDREMGPTTWATDSELTLRAPIKLLPGSNCGFAIATSAPRSLWTRMQDGLSRLFGTD